jgi:hypothetical protein
MEKKQEAYVNFIADQPIPLCPVCGPDIPYYHGCIVLCVRASSLVWKQNRLPQNQTDQVPLDCLDLGIGRGPPGLLLLDSEPYE